MKYYLMGICDTNEKYDGVILAQVQKVSRAKDDSHRIRFGDPESSGSSGGRIWQITAAALCVTAVLGNGAYRYARRHEKYL